MTARVVAALPGFVQTLRRLAAARAGLMCGPMDGPATGDTIRHASAPDRDGLRYVVALIEIHGGFTGLWLYLPILRNLVLANPGTDTEMTAAALIGLPLVGLVLMASLLAGLALWRDRRIGYVLSVPVQLAQLVWFVSASLSFRISASGWLLAELFLRLPASGRGEFGWHLNAAYAGGFVLSFDPRADFALALNLIALAILIWLVLRLRGSRAGETGR